jgi:ABC-type phosphate transport system substrate-binding protein
MTFISARRLVAVCAVSGAALAAAVAPGAASATTDLGTQCSGSSISGIGSSFQAPAQFVWTGLKGGKGFNVSTSELACNGTFGSGGKPTVTYNQESANKGSGACLKDFGIGATPKTNQFPFCGTDEAPNPSGKTEIESHAEAGVAPEALETIPVLQGSLAIIVHLPEGCKAKSEVTSGTSKIKLGRLVFDNTTLTKIYEGTIKTWKEAVAAQGENHGSDSISCTVPAEAEETIKPVVRADKSGTTHIFKEYLAQVDTAPVMMEEFNEPQGGGTKPCGAGLPEQEKTWSEVGEGCENQRWPSGIAKIRPTETGNPGVVHTVASTASTIGYADLAVARELDEFSKRFNKETGKGGGENKKGTATVQGEQNKRFWAEIQHTAPSVSPVLYADPSSNKDLEKLGNSNCAATVYAAKPGEKFPPKNTRETWFAVKAETTQTHYPICGITYDLVLRQYSFFLKPLGLSEEESKPIATTTVNYLKWVVSGKTEAGGVEIKNHDYEKLPGTVLEESEDGLEEVRNRENSPHL